MTDEYYRPKGQPLPAHPLAPNPESPDYDYGQLYKSTDSALYTIIKPPTVAGWWHAPGSTPTWTTKFAVASKPVWFHRMMMRAMFGFKWEDA